MEEDEEDKWERLITSNLGELVKFTVVSNTLVTFLLQHRLILPEEMNFYLNQTDPTRQLKLYMKIMHNNGKEQIEGFKTALQESLNLRALNILFPSEQSSLTTPKYRKEENAASDLDPDSLLKSSSVQGRKTESSCMQPKNTRSSVGSSKHVDAIVHELNEKLPGYVEVKTPFVESRKKKIKFPKHSLQEDTLDTTETSGEVEGKVFTDHLKVETYEDGKRFALIINVATNRLGAELDEPMLVQTFTGCGFEVMCCEDWSRKGITSVIKGFKEQINKAEETIGAIVVTVSSHGDNHDIFYTSDSEAMDLYEDVINQFNGAHAFKLQDVPKVFLANMCRGNKRDGPIGTDSHCLLSFKNSLVLECEQQTDSPMLRNKSPDANKAAYSRPTWTNMLVAFAAYEGHVAYRSSREGTWFFTVFCNVVQTETRLRPMCIKRILEIVSERVSLMSTECGEKQMPTTKNVGFTKSLLFQYRAHETDRNLTDRIVPIDSNSKHGMFECNDPTPVETNTPQSGKGQNVLAKEERPQQNVKINKTTEPKVEAAENASSLNPSLSQTKENPGTLGPTIHQQVIYRSKSPKNVHGELQPNDQRKCSPCTVHQQVVYEESGSEVIPLPPQTLPHSSEPVKIPQQIIQQQVIYHQHIANTCRSEAHTCLHHVEKQIIHQQIIYNQTTEGHSSSEYCKNCLAKL